MKELFKKFIPPIFLSWYHFSLVALAAFLYRFPSKGIRVIGVTGTNGKSTVVHLITKVLEEAEYKVASISSIKFKIGDKEWENKLKMTMPGRMKLQRFIRRAVATKCQYVVLEVSSEGIKQHRHRFIDFNTAVFTNLSLEHIESHGSFENYQNAKGKLFQATHNIHIINVDDENKDYFLQFPAKEKYFYSLKKEEPGVIKAKDYQISQQGSKFNIDNTEFSIKLLGEFNIYNSLAAVSLGLSQGIDLEICKRALEKVETMPGRMEEVISQPFKIFVDYAVTPDSLEKVYQMIKRDFKPNKIICVLGSCGGGRDKWKRPVLGKIAQQYCDEIILTNEDPYNEDPMEIINQIAGDNKEVKKILDRREAIKKALSLANPNDIVIITGKGSEPWMCVKGSKKIPWDDREIVREEFSKLK